MDYKDLDKIILIKMKKKKARSWTCHKIKDPDEIRCLHVKLNEFELLEKTFYRFHVSNILLEQ